jgi:hypothetical protein
MIDMSRWRIEIRGVKPSPDDAEPLGEARRSAAFR